MTHPGYTKGQQAQALAGEEGLGREYIEANLEKDGQLFLIETKHYEGEFPIGIGRRTFGEDPIKAATSHKYEIEWFERKSKAKHLWGKQPSFKLTVADYKKGSRVPIPQKSYEHISHFIPIKFSTTQEEAAKKAWAKAAAAA